jgi:hypothetical protein
VIHALERLQNQGDDKSGQFLASIMPFQFITALVIAKHILHNFCCVFVLFIFVFCTIFCPFLWIFIFFIAPSVFSNVYILYHYSLYVFISGITTIQLRTLPA